PLDAEEASVATVRRDGSVRHHAPDDPSVHGRPDARRVRTQVHRSRSRCAERDSSNGGQVGPSRRHPARGVDLPPLRTVRPKFALTATQAAQLIERLPPLGRAMAGLALVTGLRRGELFGLRWRDLDRAQRLLTVREAIYDGVISTPKTDAGRRQVPLSSAALVLIDEWQAHAYTSASDAFVFSTRFGDPLSPGNVLNRSIFPTCTALGLPRCTWLTFRRTYASWSHDKGVSGKVVAQLMGHANVDTTLNVYTQVLDGSVRAAAETVGDQLITIDHKPGSSAG